MTLLVLELHSILPVVKYTNTENPRMKFKDITDFKVIYNAYDTHISLCTPNLLTYFMDNFDFNVARQIIPSTKEMSS